MGKGRGGGGGIVEREGAWFRRGAPPQMAPSTPTPDTDRAGGETTFVRYDKEGVQLWGGRSCCQPRSGGQNERLFHRVHSVCRGGHIRAPGT